MTQWTLCSEIVGGILPMWRACRTVDGMRETDISIYGTQGDALERARELKQKKKRPHRRQPTRAHKE